MEEKFEVSEQNFTEAKQLIIYPVLCKCAKLSFIIKNFKKWKVMVLNFFNLVLQRYEKVRKFIF